jgi:hypothetical protein
MRRVTVLVTFALTTLALLQTGAQRPEPPPRDVTGGRAGSGTIHGRVTAAGDGAPLNRASVTLQGSGAGELPQVVETDDAGRYEFSRIPEGHYVLSAQRRGYVQAGFLRDVELRRGGTARVDVALERAGTISGRVVDEFGEPMADVRVEALAALPNGRLSSFSRQRETDDEGRFRLFELPPDVTSFALNRQTRAAPPVAMRWRTPQPLRRACRTSSRPKRS